MIRKVLFVLVLLVVVLATFAFVALRLRPLSVLHILGRSALRGAGLEKVQIDGPRGPLTVFRGGTGPTVVLLHGVNDQAGGWAKLAKPLIAKYHVVIPDLAGHGDSEPRNGPLTIEDMLAGIDAVLAGEPRPATLVGNSMGGWLALLTARRHPDHVSRVVLLNASGIKAEPTVSLAPRDRESARRAMDAVLGPDSPPTPDYVLDDLVRRAPTSPMARLSATSFNDHALDGRLGEIDTPVSLFWGRDDELLPPAYAEKIKAGLLRATIQYLDRCGHMPQRECADRLLPLLDAALAGR